MSDNLKTLQSIAKSNPVIQWAAAEIARLRKTADGQIRSRVAEDIAVESAWERCGITPHWPDDEAGSIVSHAESMAMEIARLREEVPALRRHCRDLMKARDEARDATQLLREERRWIPTTEKLPELYVEVAGWHHDDQVRSWFRHGGTTVSGKAWESWMPTDRECEDCTVQEPTHWQPLPRPPVSA